MLKFLFCNNFCIFALHAYSFNYACLLCLWISIISYVNFKSWQARNRKSLFFIFVDVQKNKWWKWCHLPAASMCIVRTMRMIWLSVDRSGFSMRRNNNIPGAIFKPVVNGSTIQHLLASRTGRLLHYMYKCMQRTVKVVIFCECKMSRFTNFESECLQVTLSFARIQSYHKVCIVV